MWLLTRDCEESSDHVEARAEVALLVGALDQVFRGLVVVQVVTPDPLQEKLVDSLRERSLQVAEPHHKSPGDGQLTLPGRIDLKSLVGATEFEEPVACDLVETVSDTPPRNDLGITGRVPFRFIYDTEGGVVHEGDVGEEILGERC